MRPVLPVLALAALIALPAAATGHHHAAKSHTAQGAASTGVAGINVPSALAVPYDYGTDATSAKADVTTTTTAATGGGKAAEAGQDDLATFAAVPALGAAKKHGKAQALPAY